MFGCVVPIAVLDRIDHRLADRDADPVRGVLVETDAMGDVIAHGLHDIEHLECVRELELDDAVAVCRHVTPLVVRSAVRLRRAPVVDIIDSSQRFVVTGAMLISAAFI
jgi:hypothetical protein